MTQEIKTLFPNFSNLLIEDINANSMRHSFATGDVLMKMGQYIKHTVLILSGKIKIYREGDDGGEFLMYYLHSGQACAISMICATKSETSQIMAIVDEDAELLMIPLKLMEKWMLDHKTWYEFVIDTYRSRFEDVLEVVENIAFKAMDDRLVFYLKRHQDANDSKMINLSHQDIANDLGSSREVISRLLKKMEQIGMLKLNRNQIELLN
jgi:CRP/FNR family transcriptional regulator, anaerobic regulatory protein